MTKTAQSPDAQGRVTNKRKNMKRNKDGTFAKQVDDLKRDAGGVAGDTRPYPTYDGLLSCHPLNSTWSSMVQRCTNPNADNWANYGGRGVLVCEEWLAGSRDFISWALASGWKPKLQLDRVDNDGPYSPDNCRFVTGVVNQRNKGNIIRMADGRPVVEVVEEMGISAAMVRGRIDRGWSPEEAVALPYGFHRTWRGSDPSRRMAYANEGSESDG